MKEMGAGSFKTNCLAVMDEVQAKHETVTITKHGEALGMLLFHPRSLLKSGVNSSDILLVAVTFLLHRR